MTNLPVTGFFRVTCEFGRKNTSKLKWAAGFHTGVDIVSDNRKVYSTCDGTVYNLGFDKSYGFYVVIYNKKDDTFHWFCHLKGYFVKRGQKVNRTTQIGIMGATGNVTGLHLHFEIRKSCNCYGKVNNPCDYMGIPNKVGDYHSNNYSIDKLKNGDIIKIKCLFTGTSRGENNNGESLIQVNNRQFWVYNSVLNDNKNILKAIVVYVDSNKLIVELDSSEEGGIQMWIDKSEVI